MKPITIEMFPSNIGTQTAQNLTSIRNIQFQNTKSQAAGTQGPNDSLFSDPNMGGIFINANGLAPDIYTAFEGGKKYYVTISDVPPTVPGS